MKQVLVFAIASFFYTGARAQVKVLDAGKFKVEKKSYWGNASKTATIPPAMVFTNLKVVTLPLDNMPCVVPAKAIVAPMPYKKLILEANGIPNALALEKTIVP